MSLPVILVILLYLAKVAYIVVGIHRAPDALRRMMLVPGLTMVAATAILGVIIVGVPLDAEWRGPMSLTVSALNELGVLLFAHVVFIYVGVVKTPRHKTGDKTDASDRVP